MDEDTLLAFEMSVQRITVRRSKPPHPDAEVGLFSSRKIGIRQVVWYYYVSPVYANFLKEWHKTKTHAQGVM